MKGKNVSLNMKAWECTWYLSWAVFDSMVLYQWCTVQRYEHSVWLSSLLITLVILALFGMIFWFFKALFTKVKGSNE